MLLGQDDEGEVISVGTGSACVLSSNLTADGRTVMDCHAAVIARKSLMKYDIIYNRTVDFTYITDVLYFV